MTRSCAAQSEARRCWGRESHQQGKRALSGLSTLLSNLFMGEFFRGKVLLGDQGRLI